MPRLYTSLAEIKSFKPCASGWKNILEGRGKSAADDEQFPLIECLNSNSFGDVCWLLEKRKIDISMAVEAAKMCADSVAHLGKIEAAAYAANAAYVFAANAATNATNAAYAAANAYAATNAAYAANAAANAAYAAAAYAANAAYDAQITRNKNFLRQCILAFENS